MHVKPHDVLAGEDLRPDPAQYAQAAGLVGEHAAWVFKEVGAWRWPLVQKHRDRILELIRGGYTIDLGGAAAPVGYGAVVVDYQNTFDVHESRPRSLFDVPADADCVFCSHTLEHFVDLAGAMCAIHYKLRPGGALIVQVPSWQNTNLHPTNHPFHQHIFALEWQTNAPRSFVRVDRMIEGWGFNIEEAEDDGSNMLVIATKKECAADCECRQ